MLYSYILLLASKPILARKLRASSHSTSQGTNSYKYRRKPSTSIDATNSAAQSAIDDSNIDNST